MTVTVKILPGWLFVHTFVGMEIKVKSFACDPRGLRSVIDNFLVEKKEQGKDIQIVAATQSSIGPTANYSSGIVVYVLLYTETFTG